MPVANSRLAYEVSTIVVPTNYAGMASDAARVQYLRDLLAYETVDTTALLQDRGFLDEMTPIARAWLCAHLDKIIASVT